MACAMNLLKCFQPSSCLNQIFYADVFFYLIQQNGFRTNFVYLSKIFIKCRLDNFSMSFILYYVNFSICESK